MKKFIFLLGVFVSLFISCENKQLSEESKKYLLQISFIHDIFSSPINRVENIIKKIGCKNFSKRQYRNTDEWYLECDVDKGSFIIMFNGSSKEVVEVSFIPLKPVRDTKDLLPSSLLEKKGYTVEEERDFDNNKLIARITIKPPDYQTRYTKMIEGE